ncbi:murein biosynthesis integral membrane protein MurJ [Corticibacter populi]|uniref:Murein biosynthesis integral membrane protein MurJ n=1 Tax=Corticibacter populi TaxID=1550736 RepID=A0A3M6QKH8_9BURK|nr:lipid II flippase MurJ [Corticibacter populi]RMX03527.1 murein biosynthesis integral membrane protein MurJ [Corticibacter populi]RZS29977.1 murein biosynthesis integral membrane protein MurJ [Corticibacter populi]
MFGSTLGLTISTLAGLAAGLAREWLLVAAWGAGERSDAFLVAMFLPEALRMMLAAGILSAAALPLYAQRDDQQQRQWLHAQSWALLLVGLLLGALLTLAAPLLVQLIGGGMTEAARQSATATLRVLGWTVPGLLLHSLWSIALQARQRFVLAGLGSLLFNLPIVATLALHRDGGMTTTGLAQSAVLGSVLMALALLPAALRHGWRPWHPDVQLPLLRELWRQLAPLLLSSGASHALSLLERLMASFLGEGAVTWLNLARKFINLPLIALMALNQVLLGLMSGQQGANRLVILRKGLALSTLLCLPAALGLIVASPLLPALLAAIPPDSPLPALLAWLCLPLVFGAWNALLARYAYANADTRTPLRCELLGGLVNALALLALTLPLGLTGVAMAALSGVLATNVLLVRQLKLQAVWSWGHQWLLQAVLLAGSLTWLQPLDLAPWPRLLLATAVALAVLLLCGWRLKPWR